MDFSFKSYRSPFDGSDLIHMGISIPVWNGKPFI